MKPAPLQSALVEISRFNPRFGRLRRALLTMLLTSVTAGSLTGCGADSSGAGANPFGLGGNSNSDPEVNFLVTYMKDWYLWYNRIPNVDTTSFKTPQEALTALKVSEDRYSFIDSAATFNAFFDEGKSVGFGIGLSLQGNDLFVRVVQPNSGAAAQGILRGDQILSINDELVATLIAENRLDAAIGPTVVGFVGRLKIQRGAAPLDITLTKSEYSLKYVIAPTVLSNAGRTTGYLYFTSFGEIGNTEWRAALTDFAAAGVTDLVVDLRDNGGGLLSVANQMASSLVPAGQAGGLTYRLEFNDRHSRSNQDFNLVSDGFAGRFERLAWITSPRTCSASEALITGLAPYRKAFSVGEATCGKPVGFTPPQFQGKVYSIVSFKSTNRDGFSDYFNGLPADCAVTANDFARPLGDPLESRLAAALALMAGGGCPLATKSAGGAPSQPISEVPASGLTTMTGLR